MASKCGCKIVKQVFEDRAFNTGEPLSRLDVIYCETHAAAPEYKAQADRYREGLGGIAYPKWRLMDSIMEPQSNNPINDYPDGFSKQEWKNLAIEFFKIARAALEEGSRKP